MEEKKQIMCLKCNLGIDEFSEYCSHCGAKAKIVMKTNQEIELMRKLIIDTVKNPKPSEKSPIVMLTVTMVTMFCLDWTQGKMNDEKFLKMFKEL